MTTRCDPEHDIDILRQTWSTWLDPTKNPPEERPWGSKVLVNACKEHKYISTFSQRTTITRDMYERVSGRWNELGLEGTVPVPQILAFQDDATTSLDSDITPTLEESEANRE